MFTKPLVGIKDRYLGSLNTQFVFISLLVNLCVTEMMYIRVLDIYGGSI